MVSNTRFVIAVCLVGLFVVVRTEATAQADRSAQRPAYVQVPDSKAFQLEKIRAAAERTLPRRPLTRDEFVKALEAQEPGSTRPGETGGETAVAASGFDELSMARDRSVSRPRGPKSVSVEEALEVLRGHPEGRRMLELYWQSRAPGAAISGRHSGLSRWVGWLNPFSVREAWASNKLRILLTPQQNHSSNPSASVSFYGGNLFTCCSDVTVSLEPGVQMMGGVPQSTVAPRAQLDITFPKAGEYLLVVVGYQERGVASFAQLNWDLRFRRPGWHIFPAIVQVEERWLDYVHIFDFITAAGSIAVRDVHVIEL